MMDIQLVLWVVALSVFVTLSSAETLIVGQNQGGWTLGVKYGTLNAAIGDSLVSRQCSLYSVAYEYFWVVMPFLMVF